MKLFKTSSPCCVFRRWSLTRGLVVRWGVRRVGGGPYGAMSDLCTPRPGPVWWPASRPKKAEEPTHKVRKRLKYNIKRQCHKKRAAGG